LTPPHYLRIVFGSGPARIFWNADCFAASPIPSAGATRERDVLRLIQPLDRPRSGKETLDQRDRLVLFAHERTNQREMARRNSAVKCVLALWLPARPRDELPGGRPPSSACKRRVIRVARGDLDRRDRRGPTLRKLAPPLQSSAGPIRRRRARGLCGLGKTSSGFSVNGNSFKLELANIFSRWRNPAPAWRGPARLSHHSIGINGGRNVLQNIPAGSGVIVLNKLRGKQERPSNRGHRA